MGNYPRAEFLKMFANRLTEAPSPSGDRPGMISKKGLQPYHGEWTQTQILHLLRRSLFGVKPEELKHFSSLNMQQCLDQLFVAVAPPAPPINAYNEGVNIDPDIPLGKTWVNAPYGGPLPPGLTAATRMGVIDSFRRFNLKAWWAGLMIDQQPNISQKMMLFWHTAISTQMKLVMDSRYSYRHLMLLHSHALGNFKHLVREMCTDPQMLVYQNGNTNTALAPNENFAREL